VTLRPACAADAEAMAALHALAFDAPWSAHEIASLIGGPGGFALLVEDVDGLVGFVLCRVMLDEAEVLTIAVGPPSRRGGVGGALLAAAMSAARAAGGRAMVLEAAEDNAAALALYRGAGFAEVGRRCGYYPRPDNQAVDALVLRRDLNT
jgi:ribosomal-protein-alanine N-acetyltransferase